MEIFSVGGQGSVIVPHLIRSSLRAIFFWFCYFFTSENTQE